MAFIVSSKYKTARSLAPTVTVVAFAMTHSSVNFEKYGGDWYTHPAGIEVTGAKKGRCLSAWASRIATGDGAPFTTSSISCPVAMSIRPERETDPGNNP